MASTQHAHVCIDCPTGQFKPAGETAVKSCLPKRCPPVDADAVVPCPSDACPSDTDAAAVRGFRVAELFGRMHESTVRDDTMCVRDGMCPAGTRRIRHSDGDGYDCKKCEAGTYARHAGRLEFCHVKNLHTTCKPGHYWARGDSFIHDDTMCKSRRLMQRRARCCRALPRQCRGASAACGPTVWGWFLAERSLDCLFVWLRYPDTRVCTVLFWSFWWGFAGVACPAGTYQPNESGVDQAAAPSATQGHHGTKCLAKPWPAADCSAGEYVSFGVSTTTSDIACAGCPPGQYTDAPHRTLAGCTAKAKTTCAAGFYFYTGGSLVADDNACIPCPPGTHKRTMSAATVCTPNHPSHCQGPGTYLHIGTSTRTDDNDCVEVGKCAKGHFRRTIGDHATCEPCPHGTYLATTSSSNKCTPKETPSRACPAGWQATHGDSRTANDASCTPCPKGSYSGATDAVCYIKPALVTECEAGHHVSTYSSATQDDSQVRFSHPCSACPASFVTAADQALRC